MEFNYWKNYLISFAGDEIKISKANEKVKINIQKQGKKYSLFSPYALNSNIVCNYNACGCRYNPFVWISDQLKLIYFEIPKSASTTIKTIFELNIEKDFFRYGAAKEVAQRENQKLLLSIKSNVFYHTYELKKTKKDFQNFDINQRKNKYGFKPFLGSLNKLQQIGKDYFKFAFVREPIDRFLSNYFMFKQKEHRINIFKKMFNQDPNDLSFDEFIKCTVAKKNHHWLEQAAYIPKVNDEYFVDYIGCVDNFNSDFKKLVKLKRLNLNYNIMPQNKTIRSDNELITDNNLILLKSIYKNDFDLYNKIKNN